MDTNPDILHGKIVAVGEDGRVVVVVDQGQHVVPETTFMLPPELEELPPMFFFDEKAHLVVKDNRTVSASLPTLNEYVMRVAALQQAVEQYADDVLEEAQLAQATWNLAEIFPAMNQDRVLHLAYHFIPVLRASHGHMKLSQQINLHIATQTSQNLDKLPTKIENMMITLMPQVLIIVDALLNEGMDVETIEGMVRTVVSQGQNLLGHFPGDLTIPNDDWPMG